MKLNIHHKKIIYLVILFCSIIGLKINADEDNSKLKWEIIRTINNKDLKESIKWEYVDKNEYIKIKVNPENEVRIQNEILNSNNGLLQLGKSVPTATTLYKGDLTLETSHVSTFDGGMSGGIGNQNYSGLIQYGLTDYITLSTYYTEADDPLYKKIKGIEKQPENLWSIYGGAFRWKIINEPTIKIAFESALERWRVGSGGCYGYNCNKTSNNIFNSKINKVLNDNIINSFSIPITWKYNDRFEFNIAPRLVTMPKTQGNKEGSFYGTNYGLATGITYRVSERIIKYISTYLPYNSTNSFDENLNYKGRNIYTAGINYKIDEKTKLEGYLTNSFGQTKGTSVLTIPSSNEIMYGGRFIYTPTNKSKKYNGLKREKRRYQKSKFNNSANLLKIKETILSTAYDSKGSYYIKIKSGLSKFFNLEFSNEKINKNAKIENKFINQFVLPGKNNIRGGGTALFLSREKGDMINSGIRLTYGRAMGGTRPGYLYSEIINSFNITKKINMNINPKVAWTGNGSPLAIGTGINFKLNKKIELLPEYNISISKAESNISLSLLAEITKSSTIDFSISNAVSANDMGQLFKTNNLNYGIRIEYKL